jgi:hypothetical protein
MFGLFFILSIICMLMGMHSTLNRKDNYSIVWLFLALAFAIILTGI